MKKILMAMILAVTLLTAQGCALLQDPTAQKAAVVAINAPIVIDDIDQVVVALTSLQKEKNVFSDKEIDKLVEALDMYKIVKMQYNILANLGQVPSIEDTSMLWGNVKETYSSAMEIVMSHTDSYDRVTLYNIELLNIHAKSLDISVSELLKDPTAQNISRILTMVGTMISIGAKIALTV